MNGRDRQLGWIGALGGLVGIIIMNVAPFHDLLPVNRTLIALICGLMFVWALASFTRS
ncbi:hypothetical protein [Methylobacterium iners]|uniref:Uncharacterized protein n=1 Tax=Methylobacterium iners TaxID=418707 RepID=A0ABQ4RYI0_9HYPH|nr:hypothetical protein [Methylobacterium iners]GJD95027.1 hypothetical protein OCOJLMKI_2236 [Methylobacterium iners]